jgi:hypothetical protein
MDELAGASPSDERDRAVSCHRMGKDAGIDDRRMWGLIRAAGDDDTEAVVERHQFFEHCEVGHVHLRRSSRPSIAPSIGVFAVVYVVGGW